MIVNSIFIETLYTNERALGKKVVFWTGTVNVQAHTSQEFYVDIKANKKSEVINLTIQITANGTIYSEDYVTKQNDSDSPFSILWLGQGPTPLFNVPMSPATETTLYVSLEEDANRVPINSDGNLTIIVPTAFTNLEDIGGTGWGSANITGNRIEVSNTETILNSNLIYSFNATTPINPGLFMLNISFSGTPDEHPIGNFSIHITGSPIINYELDLEIKWTNVDNSMANGDLNIFASTIALENIRVDVWNGTFWVELFADLSVGWNNVTISSYLTSSTFTIKYNSPSDVTQDSWNIDATLLRAWNLASTDNHILDVTSQKAYDQNITLTLYDYSNIDRFSNCTIWFHDGTQSVQIRITDVVVIQDSGPIYALPASSSRYIDAFIQQSSPGTSTLYVRLETEAQNSIIYSCLIELWVT